MNPGDFFIKTSRAKTTLNHSAAIFAISAAISPEMIESTRRIAVGDGGTNYSGSGQTSPLALRFICCQGWHKKHLAVLGILIGNKHSKHQYGVLIFVEISQSIHPSSLAEPDAEQIPLQRSNWISEVHPKKGSQARPGVGGSLERRFRGGC